MESNSIVNTLINLKNQKFEKNLLDFLKISGYQFGGA